MENKYVFISLPFSLIMAKIHVKTYGCTNNFHESEVMSGLLETKGNAITDESDSDTILLNLCTVKGEHHALKEVERARRKNPHKKLLIGGCVTADLRNKIKETFGNVSFFSTHNIERVTELIDLNAGADLRGVDSRRRILHPKKRDNPLVNIIPISTGCTNYCTYCSVKLIKGNVKSYSIASIVEEVKRSVADGVKEIYLTSQDTAAWGVDIDMKLPSLLKAICNVSGDFMVRLGMGNPNHFITYIDELIECLKHDKMYTFIHIPVQSGNNDVLHSMKREYTREDYFTIVTKLREAFSHIHIMTDIICGYPTETEAQFSDTLDLIQQTRPDSLNISRYQIRKHTFAASMPQISSNVKKDRSLRLTRLFQTIEKENNKKWVGWHGRVFVNEHGKHNTMKARNFAYKQVIIPNSFSIGDFTSVEIVDSNQHDLVGKPIEAELSIFS